MKKKTISLEGLGAKQAFAYFLFLERIRHMKDIVVIDRDLAKLAQMGVVPPDLPLDRWIEVEGGSNCL